MPARSRLSATKLGEHPRRRATSETDRLLHVQLVQRLTAYPGQPGRAPGPAQVVPGQLGCDPGLGAACLGGHLGQAPSPLDPGSLQPGPIQGRPGPRRLAGDPVELEAGRDVVGRAAHPPGHSGDGESLAVVELSQELLLGFVSAEPGATPYRDAETDHGHGQCVAGAAQLGGDGLKTQALFRIQPPQLPGPYGRKLQSRCAGPEGDAVIAQVVSDLLRGHPQLPRHLRTGKPLADVEVLQGLSGQEPAGLADPEGNALGGQGLGDPTRREVELLGQCLQAWPPSGTDESVPGPPCGPCRKAGRVGAWSGRIWPTFSPHPGPSYRRPPQPLLTSTPRAPAGCRLVGAASAGERLASALTEWVNRQHT